MNSGDNQLLNRARWMCEDMLRREIDNASGCVKHKLEAMLKERLGNKATAKAA